MKLSSVLLCLLLASLALARDFRPAGHMESITAADSSVQQCYIFPTIAGVRYMVESSHDLTNWTVQDEIYGLGNEYVVTMREFTPPPPPPPGTPPTTPPSPAWNASIRMERASGAAGGTVVSWASFDDRSPVIVRISGEMATGWNSVPLFAERYGAFYYFVWHPADSVEPPAENAALGPNDAAMLANLEAHLPAMNQEVTDSAARARNAPEPAPPDPDATKFWRVKVDSSSDTDGDGTPDWAEFEIAAREAGTTPAVRGDAFIADTNHDGILDGDQLDTDQDGTPDTKDIYLGDNTASFPITPLPRYGMFPILNAQAPLGYTPEALQVNDKGRVLYETGTWAGGVWTPLIPPPGGPQQIGNQIPQAIAINDNDVILGYGSFPVADNPLIYGGICCFWKALDQPPLKVTSSSTLGGRYAGQPSEGFIMHGLTPQPVLSNDNCFTAKTCEWSMLPGDTERKFHFLQSSFWTLPSGNSTLSTEAQGELSIVFHQISSLHWGYTVTRDENGSETGVRKGKVLAPAQLPDLPFFPYNVITRPNGLLALRSQSDAGVPFAYLQGGWKECPQYSYAFDIATDGTAISTNRENITAPILLNDKWTGIEITAPLQTAAFDPPPPWHDSSVTLVDTTPGGWILAQRGSYPPYDYAVMLPIRAEGYYSGSDGNILTEAVGVDDFSIGSESPGNAVQDRIWIMAPQGGFNKIVKLKAPLNSNTPLNLSASNILLNGQESATVSAVVNAVTLRAADTESSGGERLMTVRMGSGDNEVSSVSEPIGLKIMKGRTVNVTVYKVTKIYGSDPPAPTDRSPDPVDEIMMPTQDEITKHLKDIFRPQINVVFNVNLVEEPLRVHWDTAHTPFFDIHIDSPIPGEEDAILAKIPANPAPYDIRVFIVANPGGPLGADADAYGITDRAQRTSWVHGSLFGRNRSKPFLLDTIAHEIGHVLVGVGHPDKNTFQGQAPLPGTQHTRRLMVSGPNSNSSSHLLVKGEWDEAEKWLKAREQQGGLGQ